MILTCPNCATRYQADAAKFLPAGRNVKCAKCGYTWRQGPPPAEPEPEAVLVAPEPAVEAPQPFHEPAHTPRPGMFATEGKSARASETTSRTGVWAQRAVTAAGVVALALLFFLVGWTAVHFREDIAANWPQTARLYRTVGLAVSPRGIEIVDVVNGMKLEGGAKVLVVTGKLVNVSRRELPVPAIRVALLDGTQHELYHWPVTAGVDTLRPGQSTPFQTRLPNPPRATQVQVTLARGDE